MMFLSQSQWEELSALVKEAQEAGTDYSQPSRRPTMLYEIAVVLKPTKEEAAKGELGTILVPIHGILAPDTTSARQQAVIEASRAKEMTPDEINRLDVSAVPFGGKD